MLVCESQNQTPLYKKKYWSKVMPMKTCKCSKIFGLLEKSNLTQKMRMTVSFDIIYNYFAVVEHFLAPLFCFIHFDIFKLIFDKWTLMIVGCVCLSRFGISFTYVIESIDSKLIPVCLINDYSLIADIHIEWTKVKLLILNDFAFLTFLMVLTWPQRKLAYHQARPVL